MDVSKNIRAARTEKGITQVDIARQLGIERTNYHRLENRGNKLTIEQATAIAQALNMSLIELLTWGDIEKNERSQTNGNHESVNRVKEISPTLSIVQEYAEVLKSKLSIAYGSFTSTIKDIGEKAGLGTDHIVEEDEIYTMYHKVFNNKELIQIYDILYVDHPALYQVYQDLFQRDVLNTTTREAKVFLRHRNRKLGDIPH